jgi:hypothetical protein
MERAANVIISSPSHGLPFVSDISRSKTYSQAILNSDSW